MDPNTADLLIELNLQFYQNLAGSFSETRRRLQPGVARLLEGFSPQADILDLGCGNAELWRALAARGHCAVYLGLDFSLPLLETRERSGKELLLSGYPLSSQRIATACSENQACFIEADLIKNDWETLLINWRFPLILAFALLHHVPGESNRLLLLEKIHQLLAPGGVLCLSVWQFLSSPRLRSRIQPWEKVGLQPDQVDPEDYLLDWKHGGYGLRYVHHFSEAELFQLASATDFRVRESFSSDGENGKLSLYQVWEFSG